MIWVAIAIGSLLGSLARHAGMTGAQVLPDLWPMYRHLWEQRVDGFLVGVITGLSSQMIVAQNQPRQSMAAIGLCAAFAISSTIGRSESGMASGAHSRTWSCFAREITLAIVAAVAGWLIASVR